MLIAPGDKLTSPASSKSLDRLCDETLQLGIGIFNRNMLDKDFKVSYFKDDKAAQFKLINLSP